MPAMLPEVMVIGRVGELVSSSISYQNPFDYPVIVRFIFFFLIDNDELFMIWVMLYH
jgi:hypothetical protein